MFDQIMRRKRKEERQERRLGSRFSVFFVVFMKRVFSVAILALILTGIGACGTTSDEEEALIDYSDLKQNNKDIYNLLDAEEALEQEEISMLIREMVLVKGEDWKSLELKAEVLEDKVSLQLSDETETVVINIFFAQYEQELEAPLTADRSEWDEFEALWQQCGALLHEEGIEDYERFSWHMTDAAQRERETLGKFILYQTVEGKQGFFRQNGEMLYQVETWGGSEEGNQDEVSPFDIQEVKTQIKKLSVTEEKGKKQDEWKEPESGLYEIILWKLWDGHMPAWGVGWDSALIWDAVYSNLSQEDGMPAWEEIGEEEYLFVSFVKNDRIETLSDLEKLPHLKELYLGGICQNPVNFDLTKEMIPELEELTISCIGLADLSFLEYCPQLKNLH
ncbi:MAG: hypothetical protein K2N82_05715, partial [Lachnospiraceae bacterium]|nr:hypothetical protein [Lachnospiraceae bacterium]